MNPSVTRCPSCSSTFNISQRQLESSGGLARCGACLRVFPAAEYLIEPGEDTDSADSVFIGQTPEEYFNPDSFVNQAQEPAKPEPDRPTHAPPPESPVRARHVSPAAQDKSDDVTLAEPVALPEFESRFEVLPEDRHKALGQLRPTSNLRAGKSFNWVAFTGQTTVALMLLLLLSAQYLWRYLPVYSQVDWLRPHYARICVLAGCEMPAYSRVISFRNDNTALRTHPNYPDAYLLVAQFHNAAPFPQPFPVVVLRFTSLDARTVAVREFAPDEYLPPGLLALDLMPPNSPVQFELELMNPGPEAVNYEVSFRGP